MKKYTQEQVLEIMMAAIRDNVGLEENETIELDEEWQNVCDSLDMTDTVLDLQNYFDIQDLPLDDFTTFRDLYKSCLEKLRQAGKLIE